MMRPWILMKPYPKSLNHLMPMAMTPRYLTLRTNLLQEWISAPFLPKPKKIFSKKGIWVVVVLSQVFRALMLPQGSMAGLCILWAWQCYKEEMEAKDFVRSARAWWQELSSPTLLEHFFS